MGGGGVYTTLPSPPTPHKHWKSDPSFPAPLRPEPVVVMQLWRKQRVIAGYKALTLYIYRLKRLNRFFVLWSCQTRFSPSGPTVVCFKLSLPGGYAHENKQFPSSSRLLSANQRLKPSDACQPENIWLYTQLQLMHCQYLVLSLLRYVVRNCDIVQCTYFQVFFFLAISAMTQKKANAHLWKWGSPEG